MGREFFVPARTLLAVKLFNGYGFGQERKPCRLYFLGRYVPMVGIQFGRIVSFSLTLHTWELKVTSEVRRKMILLGHSIRYVIYHQSKGHLRIMFNVLFGFSISEKKKLHSFGINTSVYKHVSTIIRILGTDSLSRKF